MFSEAEQKAIKEKTDQLIKIKEGTLSPQELADLITQRRVAWIEKHRNEMLAKYEGLNPVEQAYKIILFEHMGINPEHSKMIWISQNKIRIESSNFCPYLEACKRLGMDTVPVCREIGEPSIQEMLKRINPNLRFSRDYKNIRPHNRDLCEEYIELV
jgi:hypothetical protein